MNNFKALADILCESQFSQSKRKEDFVSEKKRIMTKRRFNRRKQKAEKREEKRKLDDPFELGGAL